MVQLKRERGLYILLSTVFASIGAFLSVYAINLHFFHGRADSYAYSVLNVVLFLFAFVFLHLAAQCRNPRIIAVSAVCAAVFSLVIVIGDSIAHTNDLGYLESRLGIPGTLISLAGFLFLFFACLVFLFDCLDSLHLAQGQAINGGETYCFTGNRTSVLFVWILIFLAWLPCFLAYYPGITSYDIETQMWQISSGNYTSQHSIIHTGFLHGMLLLGAATKDYYGAIAVFTIAQMLAVSLFFSLCVYSLAKAGAGTGVRVFALLYYMLSPMMAVFSIITTKDVFFGSFFLASVILAFDMIKDPDAFFRSGRKLPLLAAAILMACMFRNNATYVYAIFFVFAMLCYRKHVFRLLCLGVAALVVALALVCIEGPLYSANDVVTDSEKAAVLCVPLMQIASAAKHNAMDMDPAQLAAVKRYIDPEGYNPRFADPVLRTFETDNYDEDHYAFFRLWLDLSRKYPDEYINVFLSLNLAYWYPDMDPHDPFSQRAYIETMMKDVSRYCPEMPSERRSLLPALLPAYESFSVEASQKDYPVVATFFSLALPLWLMALCSAFCIIQRKQRFLLALLLPFSLWLSYIFGPVANVRYMYPLFVLYPVFAALLFDGNYMANRPKTSGRPEHGRAPAPKARRF